MSLFFTRLLFVISNVALIGIVADRAVHAQSFPANTAEVVPNSDQVPPSEQPPVEQKTRPLRNYIGIGGSIGVSGNRTGLSEGGAAIITKNDLNDSLSIRGVSIFGSHRTDNTFALTVNFPVRSRSGQVILTPFIGGGALLSSKYNFDDFIVRGLVTGGIDVPLSRRFTVTTSVNVGFTNAANVGIQAGVAYNF